MARGPAARGGMLGRAAAAALALLILTASVTAWMSFGATAYATAIGERRTIKIRGLGAIDMNTDTRLSVRRFGPPRVRLLHGEALVSAPHVKAPIVVSVGREHIVSAGAEFGVRLKDDLIRVMVEEGEVNVSQKPGLGSSQPSRRISAGWIGEVGHDRYTERQVDSREFARLLAWRFGAISLSGETVQEAVDEFNRYNERQIVVTDANLKQRHVGGYFQTEDIDGFAAGVGRLFGATTRDNGHVIYLSEKRP